MYSSAFDNRGMIEFSNGTTLSVQSLPNGNSPFEVAVASTDRAKPDQTDYNNDIVDDAGRSAQAKTDTAGSFNDPADSCNYVCPGGYQTASVDLPNYVPSHKLCDILCQRNALNAFRCRLQLFWVLVGICTC